MSFLSRWKTQFSVRFLRRELSRVIHEFQLKWKTYLLLYYAIPLVHRFRSQEKGALYPFSHIQNFISIFPLFLKDVTHLHFPVLADQNSLIETKRIISSWWHWIRLLFPLNTLHTVDSLITGSRCHTFVSTNVRALPPFLSAVLMKLDSFPVRVPMPRNLPWIIFQSLV